MRIAAGRTLILTTLLLLADFRPAVGEEHKDAFGDPLPPGAFARLGPSRFRLAGLEDTLDLAPDGQSYVHGREGALFLCETTTGKVIRTLEPPPTEGKGSPPAPQAAFSPDGRFLVGGHADRWSQLSLFHLAGGKREDLPCKTATARWGPPVFSADGNRLTCGQGGLGAQNNVLEVVDLPGRKVVFSVKAPEWEYCKAVLSGDGKLLAAWYARWGQQPAKVLRVWEVETGKELDSLGAGMESCAAVAFSPDGRHLATAADTIAVWDVKTGKKFKEYLGGRNNDCVLCYSPDGQLLLAADAGGVTRIWDAATGERRIWRGPSARPRAVRFLPDGKVLALGTQGLAICLWEVNSGKVLSPQNAHVEPIRNLTFSRDGRTLISVGNDGVRWWDLTGFTDRPAATGGRCEKHFQPQTDDERMAHGPLSIRAMPGGTVLRLASGGVEVLDPKTGQPIRVLPGVSHTPLILSVDGRTLITQERPDRLAVSDVQTGRKLLSVPVPAAESCDAALSDNRRILAVLANRPQRDERFPGFLRAVGPGFGGYPHSITPAPGEWNERPTELHTWDLAAGKEKGRYSFDRQVYSALACSPDGRLLACANRDLGSIRLWDVEGGVTRGFLDSAGQRIIDEVLFSPDGRLLLSVSNWPRRIVIWELASRVIRHDWKVPDFLPHASGFSADGQWLATGCSNGSILVWDMSGRWSRAQQPARPLAEEQLERLWTELDDTREGKGFPAMSALLQAPDQTLALLQKRLEPVRNEPAKGSLVRSLRAVEVLERLGTPTARQLLQTVAAGRADAELTEAARAALQRLAP